MEFKLCPLSYWTSTVLLLFNVKYAFWNLNKALDKLYLNFKSGIKCFAFFKCISKHILKYYPRTYSTNFFYKNFVLFIMYWNKIIPRGLGLNFFSLVLIGFPKSYLRVRFWNFEDNLQLMETFSGQNSNFWRTLISITKFS